LLIGFFLKFKDRLQHPWLLCTIVLIALFFGIWWFIHRSMIRNECTLDNQPKRHPSRPQ
jgi:hypothetical protein